MKHPGPLVPLCNSDMVTVVTPEPGCLFGSSQYSRSQGLGCVCCQLAMCQRLESLPLGMLLAPTGVVVLCLAGSPTTICIIWFLWFIVPGRVLLYLLCSHFLSLQRRGVEEDVCILQWLCRFHLYMISCFYYVKTVLLSLFRQTIRSLHQYTMCK